MLDLDRIEARAQAEGGAYYKAEDVDGSTEILALISELREARELLYKVYDGGLTVHLNDRIGTFLGEQ